MENKEIVIYSKKNGVNQFLFLASDLIYTMELINKRYIEHKLFAYALVEGIEVKLFTDRGGE